MTSTRLPAFADDRWYASSPAGLAEEVTRLMPQIATPQEVIGLIAPHAGYFYSGKVAGAVYAAVDVPDRVIVISPNHRGIGAPCALSSDIAWRIPGRDIPLDVDAANLLQSKFSPIVFDSTAHSQEHSLEVQLPFLNARNPNFSLVALCVFPQRLATCRQLGQALAETVEELSGNTLLVASSDMNHYESAHIGNNKDKMAIERVLSLDPEGLHHTVLQNDISMCGMVPATIVMFAALALGAKNARLVKYADSGDANGDKSSVVGYAGLTIS